MSSNNVCKDCIDDDDLREVVKENAEATKCDYCEATSDVPIACSLWKILERIRLAIYQEYSRPEEETIYDPEIGDYHGDVLFHTDVFDEIGFGPDNSQLLDDILDHFWDERFCRKGMLSGSISERQMDAWHGFKKIVKNHRRYTFWSIDAADYDVIEHPPSKVIANITRTISEFDLMREVPTGTPFWRVRVHDCSESISQGSELAAPNCDQAVHANRMSPAGVSMFYGADEFDTAIRETIDPQNVSGKLVTGCQFQSLTPLVILDLLNLPRYGFFSTLDEHEREGIAFLQDFQFDISQKVKKDGQHHIDYVPTQVFTEYVRYEIRSAGGKRVDGIRFRSSKDANGCYVLFCDQDDCLPDLEFRDREQQLEFDPSSLDHRDAEKWVRENT